VGNLITHAVSIASGVTRGFLNPPYMTLFIFKQLIFKLANFVG